MKMPYQSPLVRHFFTAITYFTERDATKEKHITK